MKHLIAAFALLLASLPASAVTYYYSKCDAGAHASCVAGNDANDGLSATTPRLTIPTAPSSANVYRMARGGSWVGVRWDNLSTFGWNFEDYTPSGCTGDCSTQKPMLTAVIAGAATAEMFRWVSRTGSAVTLKNLHIIGGANGDGNAIEVNGGNVTGLVMDGLIIEKFGIGVYINSNAIGDHRGAKLLNSTIRLNHGQGLLGSGQGMLIEGNTFTDNGEDAFDHNIYLSRYARGVVIRGNTLTGAGGRVDGVCRSASLLAHGSLPDAIVENNNFTELSATSGCIAVAMDSNTDGTTPQNFSRLIVRGNKVLLDGLSTLTGITCSSCPDALVENNIIVRLSPSSGTFTGIRIPSQFAQFGLNGRADTPDTKATIRNNSIYIDTTSTDSVAIYAGNTGSGDVVASNAIFYGAQSSASARCFNVNGRAAASFTAFDSNSCYRAAGSATWSDLHSTVAAAISAGFGANNAVTDPGLTTPASGNSYALEASSGSAAVIDTANATYKSRLGFGGKPANGSRDRGACEYRTGDACSAATASVPSSPTNAR